MNFDSLCNTLPVLSGKGWMPSNCASCSWKLMQMRVALWNGTSSWTTCCWRTRLSTKWTQSSLSTLILRFPTLPQGQWMPRILVLHRAKNLRVWLSVRCDSRIRPTQRTSPQLLSSIQRCSRTVPEAKASILKEARAPQAQTNTGSKLNMLLVARMDS